MGRDLNSGRVLLEAAGTLTTRPPNLNCFNEIFQKHLYSCCILFGMVTLQGENIAGKNRDIVKHQVTLLTINFYPIRGQGVGYIYIFIILN